MAQLLSHQRNPLGRTVRLLGWMADHDQADYGVRELAAAISMAPSTVHRSLGALEEEGLVESESDSGRYRLSLGFYRLALRGAARAPVLAVALPYLRQATRASGETALLALYDPVAMATMFVAEAAGKHFLQVRPELHQWKSVTVGAAGLAVLSRLDQDTVGMIFSREKSQQSSADLAASLGQTRERGYAVCVPRPGAGFCELAAPFGGPGRLVLGALWMGVPEHRFNPALEQALAELLVGLGQQVSKALGGPNAQAKGGSDASPSG